MANEIIREPKCFYCTRLIYYPHCEAFPEGIPDEIKSGENDHTKPVDGDNGIRFTPMKTEREKVREVLDKWERESE